jgi:hypothetical protein
MQLTHPVLWFFMSATLVSVAQAGVPVLSIQSTGTFFTRPQQVIQAGKFSFIHYVVKNNSARNTQFTINLPAGVTESQINFDNVLPLCNELAGSGLDPQQRCVLSLIANAGEIGVHGKAQGGPDLCIGKNGFGCFRPTPNNSLSVTVSPLNSSVTGLALSVNNSTPPFSALTGTPRRITLTSGDGSVIGGVSFSFSPALPADASVVPANQSCGDISPTNPCVIHITPGATPTSSSSIMTVTGNNIQPLSIPVDILTYGSVFQSGYVFAIDDSTPTTLSVGGKVAAQQNQAPLFPFGIIWSSNGNYSCKAGANNNYAPCTNYTFIPGIDENSTPPGGCAGNSDGACNTRVIVTYLDNNNLTTPGTPVTRSTYAAGLCTATINGYSDWYLPAICELGYYQPAPNTPNINSGCGTPSSPILQNIASNLPSSVLLSMQGPFWSSTEYSGEDTTFNNAWSNYFTTNTQTHDGKENALGVRCVRAMTQSN